MECECEDEENLKNLIQNQNRKSMNESKILDTFDQLCLAIKYLHGRKILH
jgi:serine/threonine protein kinase